MGIVQLLCRSSENRQRLESCRDRLYRVAYSWTHDPYLADDLVQETLAKAIKALPNLRDPATLEGWVFTILANTWRSHLRARREMVEFLEENHGTDECPEEINQRLETINSVHQAIAELSLGQREVITLVDLEGFSYAEVAAILDIPIGTVMSRLCRARQALKTLLLNHPQQDTVKERKLVRIK